MITSAYRRKNVETVNSLACPDLSRGCSVIVECHSESVYLIQVRPILGLVSHGTINNGITMESINGHIYERNYENSFIMKIITITIFVIQLGFFKNLKTHIV